MGTWKRNSPNGDASQGRKRGREILLSSPFLTFPFSHKSFPLAIQGHPETNWTGILGKTAHRDLPHILQNRRAKVGKSRPSNTGFLSSRGYFCGYVKIFFLSVFSFVDFSDCLLLIFCPFFYQYAPYFKLFFVPLYNQSLKENLNYLECHLLHQKYLIETTSNLFS